MGAAMVSLIWLMHFFGCLWIFVMEPCEFNQYQPVYAYTDRPIPYAVNKKIGKYFEVYPEASECNHVWEMYATALDWGTKTTLGSSPVELDLDKWNYNLDWETTGAVHCFGFFAS